MCFKGFEGGGKFFEIFLECFEKGMILVRI